MQIRKNKRVIIVKLALIIAIFMLITLVSSPPRYYLIMPGETKLATTLIGHAEQDSGSFLVQLKDHEEQFYYTTVLLSEPNWGDVIKSSFHPHHTFIAKNQLLQGKSFSEYRANSYLTMKQSWYQALEAAYQYMDIPYNKQIEAVYVNKETRHKGAFFDGDIIKAIVINGESTTISNISELLIEINRLPSYSTYQYSLIVETETKEREIEIEHNPNTVFPLTKQQLAELYQVAAFIEVEEVVSEDEQYRFKMEEKHVGGPSAGLIMSLSLIDLIQDDHIVTPFKIAATGTIQADGSVGIIGSIEQKVVAVDEAGIDLFIVPNAQVEAAKKKAKSIDSAIKIVGVAKLSEAVQAINQFKNKDV